MRIHFVRTGGFAGIKLETRADSDTLPPVEARAIEQEVAQSNFFQLPSQIKSMAGGVDRFQYEITVEDGPEVHTVAVGETEIPETLQPLVQHLNQLARTRR